MNKHQTMERALADLGYAEDRLRQAEYEVAKCKAWVAYLKAQKEPKP